LLKEPAAIWALSLLVVVPQLEVVDMVEDLAKGGRWKESREEARARWDLLDMLGMGPVGPLEVAVSCETCVRFGVKARALVGLVRESVIGDVGLVTKMSPC
jgi:hypothetical protein